MEHMKNLYYFSYYHTDIIYNIEKNNSLRLFVFQAFSCPHCNFHPYILQDDTPLTPRKVPGTAPPCSTDLLLPAGSYFAVRARREHQKDSK